VEKEEPTERRDPFASEVLQAISGHALTDSEWSGVRAGHARMSFRRAHQ